MKAVVGWRAGANVQVVKRAFAVVSVMTACIVVLSACQFFTRPPDFGFAVKETNGDLVFAVCRDFGITSLSGEERTPDGPWIRFWDLQAFSIDLAAGQSFSANDLNDDGAASDQPRLDDGDEIAIALHSTNDGDILGNFVVPDGGLPSDGWLLANGQVSSSPCK